MRLAVCLGLCLACAGVADAQGDVSHAIPGGPAAPVPPSTPAPPPGQFPAQPSAGLPQLGVPAGAAASQPLPAAGLYRLVPAQVPTIHPGTLLLLGLEGRFADEVAAEGGRAFARWMAEDAVTLANGQPAVVGRGAIAATAQWSPKDYQLTWVAEGARMGPSGDMGFTWGRYRGRTLKLAADGKAPALVTGRYMTVWRREQDGAWKVVLDSSADAPPAD